MGLVRHRFPYLVAIAFTLFCVITRAAHHVPWGPGVIEGDTPRGQSTALLSHPADNFSYAAWAQQCRDGHYRMQSLYTVEPHPAVLFNPYFAAVGIISRFTHVHVIWIMNVFGAACAVAAVVFIYHTAFALGWGVSAARCACVLMAFGSGLTGLQNFLALRLLGRRLLNGVDVVYLDAIGHSTFMVYPYHATALAVLAGTVWVIVLAIRAKNENAPARLKYQAAAVLLVFVLSWIHPYEVLLPVAAMIVWVALVTLAAKGPRPSAQTNAAPFAWCGLLCVAVAPSALYGIWMSTQPVWDQFTLLARTIPVSARQWIVGYGIFLPLGAIGWYRVIRAGEFRRDSAGWLVAWFALLVVLLIGLQVQFTKICNGGPVVMCLLGGLGAATCWEWAGRWGRAWYAPARLAVAVALALSFTTLPALDEMYRILATGVGNPPTRFDPQIDQLIARTPRPPDGRPLRVLCDVQTGGLLPGLYGCQVFAGHWALTPDFHRRAAMLYDVGLTPPTAPTTGPAAEPLGSRPAAETSSTTEPPASLEHFQILVSHYDWDRVLIAKRSPAEAFAWGEPRLHLVAETSRWAMFAVEPSTPTR